MIGCVGALDSLLDGKLVGLVSSLFGMIVALNFVLLVSIHLALCDVTLLPILFKLILFVGGHRQVTFRVLDGGRSGLGTCVRRDVSKVGVARSFTHRRIGCSVFGRIDRRCQAS